MNEASINIFNAIAFPPVQAAGRVPGDPFFTRENDPVTAAIAREFGRLALGLLLTLILAVGLALTAFPSLSPTAHRHVAAPGAPSPAVASASPSTR